MLLTPKPALLAALAAGLMTGAVCVSIVTQKLTVRDLRCEYLEAPLGIDMLHPRFSWILESPERGVSQTAYQVLVARSEKALKDGKADRWDSGKVESEKSINIVYEGDTLISGETYYWKVRVWDHDSTASPWSKATTFQMGLRWRPPGGRARGSVQTIRIFPRRSCARNSPWIKKLNRPIRTSAAWATMNFTSTAKKSATTSLIRAQPTTASGCCMSPMTLPIF